MYYNYYRSEQQKIFSQIIFVANFKKINFSKYYGSKKESKESSKEKSYKEAKIISILSYLREPVSASRWDGFLLWSIVRILYIFCFEIYRFCVTMPWLCYLFSKN
jgi:dolichol kinase